MAARRIAVSPSSAAMRSAASLPNGGSCGKAVNRVERYRTAAAHRAQSRRRHRGACCAEPRLACCRLEQSRRRGSWWARLLHFAKALGHVQIVSAEGRCCSAHKGTVKRTSAPCGARGDTHKRPPWASTIDRQMASAPTDAPWRPWQRGPTQRLTKQRRRCQ